MLYGKLKLRMKVKKVIKSDINIEREDNYFWFYLGDKYYKRMQPIPYKATEIDIKKLKIIIKSIKN